MAVAAHVIIPEAFLPIDAAHARVQSLLCPQFVMAGQVAQRQLREVVRPARARRATAGSLHRSLACRAEPRQNLAGNLIEPDDILIIAEPADLALDE